MYNSRICLLSTRIAMCYMKRSYNIPNCTIVTCKGGNLAAYSSGACEEARNVPSCTKASWHWSANRPTTFNCEPGGSPALVGVSMSSYSANINMVKIKMVIRAFVIPDMYLWPLVWICGWLHRRQNGRRLNLGRLIGFAAHNYSDHFDSLSNVQYIKTWKGECCFI